MMGCKGEQSLEFLFCDGQCFALEVWWPLQKELGHPSTFLVSLPIFHLKEAAISASGNYGASAVLSEGY